MSWAGCSEREELRAVLRRGQWPDGCPAELVKHVEGCAACRQEVLVTAHLQSARASAVAEAPSSVSPSLLWWRAQTRRREAALKQAARPLAAAQVFALVVMVAAVVGFVAWQWPAVLALGTQAGGGLSLARLEAEWGVVPVMAALALVSALGGVVALLTVERQR